MYHLDTSWPIQRYALYFCTYLKSHCIPTADIKSKLFFFYVIPVKEMLSSIYRALSVWEAGKTSVCQKCVLENAACTCKLQKSAGAGAASPPSRPWTVSEDLGTQAPQSSWMQTPLKPDMHPVWGLCRLDPCLDTFTYAKPWLYQFQHSQTWVNQLPSNHAAWFTC